MPLLDDFLVVHVQVRVKPDAVDAFREAILANAAASRQEPGVVRFDVVQDLEDRTRFVLVEVYRGAEAAAAHKDTAHYKTWRAVAEPLMAEPRTARKFQALSPDAAGW